MRSRARGFSLVELLVSAAILGVLASVAMPAVELVQKRQREADLRAALHDIRAAIDAYKQAAMEHRIEVADGESGYPPSLEALSAGVADKAHPDGPALYFLRRIPRDPFNFAPETTAADSWGQRSFDSPPEAPRAGADVYDVYSTSAGTGLNGIPYAEW